MGNIQLAERLKPGFGPPILGRTTAIGDVAVLLLLAGFRRTCAAARDPLPTCSLPNAVICGALGVVLRLIVDGYADLGHADSAGFLSVATGFMLRFS